MAHEAQEVLETTSTRRGSGVLDPRDELDEEAVHRGGRRDRLALFERQDPLKHVAQHGTAPARVADAPEPREKARIGDGRFEQALQQCLGAHGARNAERPGEEEVSPLLRGVGRGRASRKASIARGAVSASLYLTGSFFLETTHNHMRRAYCFGTLHRGQTLRRAMHPSHTHRW